MSGDGGSRGSGDAAGSSRTTTRSPERDREVRASVKTWREALLNVSGASRLRDYRETKTRTITISSPDPDMIFRALVEGRPLTLQGRLPDEPIQDGSQPPGETGTTNRSSGAPKNVLVLESPRPHDDVAAVARQLMRQANTEWLDRGLHTLYLAIGMLHWVDVDRKTHTSPLLLVPVEFTSAGPSSMPWFTLFDDPIMNPTLVAEMERNHDVTLPSVTASNGGADTDNGDEFLSPGTSS